MKLDGYKIVSEITYNNPEVPVGGGKVSSLTNKTRTVTGKVGNTIKNVVGPNVVNYGKSLAKEVELGNMVSHQARMTAGAVGGLPGVIAMKAFQHRDPM
jgi:hypothetical protein